MSKLNKQDIYHIPGPQKCCIYMKEKKKTSIRKITHTKIINYPAHTVCVIKNCINIQKILIAH